MSKTCKSLSTTAALPLQQKASSSRRSTHILVLLLTNSEVTPEGLSYYTIQSPRLDFVAPRIQDHEDSPNPPATNTIGPLKMAFYERKNVDQWISVANQAATLVTAGRYTEAKTMLLNSLDGLEVLLGPDDSRTTDLLNYFVESAVSNEDFGEAANRLHKSHRNHSDNLGQTHVRTWQSLIRLGDFYMNRGQSSQAYHMLFNARQGLLAAFENNPEQALNYTQTVSENIVQMHMAQHNFLAAEEEIKLAIDRSKAAGNLYESATLKLRHKLVHLYNDDAWNDLASEGRMPYPTRNGVEQLLLEDIVSLSRSSRYLVNYSEVYLCSLEQLRILYERTFQHDKLPTLLTRIENHLTTHEFAPSPAEFNQSLVSVKGVALSYQTLHKYENAEWWLLYRQQQINMAPSLGSTSPEAVGNQMHLVQLYAVQKKTDEEREALKHAQSLAREALPPDHEFHEYVASVLGGTRAKAKRCKHCFVNEVAKRVAPRVPRRIDESDDTWNESEPTSGDEESNEIE